MGEASSRRGCLVAFGIESECSQATDAGRDVSHSAERARLVIQLRRKHDTKSAQSSLALVFGI